MKYIYYIIAIASVISLIISFSYFDQSAGDGNDAIRVNDRQISFSEFEKKFSVSRSKQISKKEFIDSLILKELLIQEAKNAGVDKEETFRDSIQNFYEQSLSKILMDRKYAAIEVSVSQAEVDRYADLIGADISLAIIDPSLSSAQQKENAKVISDRFDNLSTDIKMNIYPLEVGEQTGEIEIFDSKYIIRLDSVAKGIRQELTGQSRNNVEQLISQYKKERQFKLWIDALRTNAIVKINDKII